MPVKCMEAALISEKKSLGLCRQTWRASRRLDKQIKPVQLLPQLEGDLIAHHPRVLPRLADALHDGVRVFRLEHQEFRHGRAGGLGMQLGKGLLVAGRLDNRQPLFGDVFLVQIADVQQQLQAGVHQARRVLRALNVARHPVK